MPEKGRRRDCGKLPMFNFKRDKRQCLAGFVHSGVFGNEIYSLIVASFAGILPQRYHEAELKHGEDICSVNWCVSSSCELLIMQLIRLVAQASNSSICISCQRLSRRHYASTAAATAAVPAESSPASSKSSPPSAKATSNATPRPIYQMHAGVVLSRPPMLTRELHPFESAYFFYQRRLNERLALPFTRYFYFKKGTPADLEWKRKQKERITAARDIGIYNAYGKEGWNDELMVGDKESDPQHQLEALLKDAEEPAVGEGEEVVDEEKSASKRKEVERPMDRVTEADKQCDLRSLNRMLARTLYLVVKGEDGKWRLPSARLEGKEGLARVCDFLHTRGLC